jgi:hypothetical protein
MMMDFIVLLLLVGNLTELAAWSRNCFCAGVTMHWEIRVPGYLGAFIIGRGGDVCGIRSSGLLTVMAPRPSSEMTVQVSLIIGDGLATGCAILTITEEAPSTEQYCGEDLQVRTN